MQEHEPNDPEVPNNPPENNHGATAKKILLSGFLCSAIGIAAYAGGRELSGSEDVTAIVLALIFANVGWLMVGIAESAYERCQENHQNNAAPGV